MRKFFIILCASSLFAFSSAWALNLSQAKNSGLVGETPSGYLAAVASPNAATKKLVQDINARRKAQYKKIAAQNNTSMQAVESLAGKKAISKTAKGHFIRVGGRWVKK